MILKMFVLKMLFLKMFVLTMLFLKMLVWKMLIVLRSTTGDVTMR